MKAESNKTNVITEIRLVQSLLNLQIEDFKELRKLTVEQLTTKLIELRKQYRSI